MVSGPQYPCLPVSVSSVGAWEKSILSDWFVYCFTWLSQQVETILAYFGLANNSDKKVSVTLLFYLQPCYQSFCSVWFYLSVLCRLCVFVLNGLRVCYKTLQLKKKLN